VNPICATALIEGTLITRFYLRHKSFLFTKQKILKSELFLVFFVRIE